MRLHRREKAQGLSEYALLLLLIALASVGILTLLGTSITDGYFNILFEVSKVSADAAVLEEEGSPSPDAPSAVILSAPNKVQLNITSVGFIWHANPAAEHVDSYRIQVFSFD